MRKVKTYKRYDIFYSTARSAYLVSTPCGIVWLDLAANIETAQKWIDADILEKQGALC